MKIIILGAGRIGESVAGTLVSERNDITVIDTDAQRLRQLEERIELRGVVGSGIEPDVLAEAGARDADMLIACAAQDEALPWFWRSVCLEHVNLPLAHLATTLGVHDPIAMHALEAAVQRARDQLPVLPRMPASGDLTEPEVRPNDLL